MFTTREEFVRSNPDSVSACAFSAITAGQPVREAKEWFIRRLSIKDDWPLKLSIRRVVG
jgi:hypothetical protein